MDYPYFWGRHSGQWHPRCYARRRDQLGRKYGLVAITGCWIVRPGRVFGEEPEEYRQEVEACAKAEC